MLAPSQDNKLQMLEIEESPILSGNSVKSCDPKHSRNTNFFYEEHAIESIHLFGEKFMKAFDFSGIYCQYLIKYLPNNFV